MNFNLLEDFFDFNSPCPKEIKNCDSLRKEYSEKLIFLQKMNSCANCNINELKAYFVDRIKHGFK
jgi:hypothetical protein